MEWQSKLLDWKKYYQSLLDPKTMKKIEREPLFVTLGDLGEIAGRYKSPDVTGGPIHIIEMSTFLAEAEAKETFGHEFAHMVMWCLYGIGNHGKRWRRLMTVLGLPPLPCHTLNLKGRKTLRLAQERLTVL